MLNGWALKWRRAVAYKNVFSTADAQTVIADLVRFCHGDRTSVTVGNGRVDPNATLVAEGRREVLLRILDYAGLTPDQMRLLAEQARHEENR